MKVKLPRSCRREEVVAEFVRAGTFKISSEEEFVAGVKTEEIIVEPGSVKFVETIKSVTSKLWKYEHGRGFWGRDVSTGKLCFSPRTEKEWCDKPDQRHWHYGDYATISLKPLAVQNEFSEVEVDFSIGFPCEVKVGEAPFNWRHISDPTNARFGEIAKPTLKAFIKRFFDELSAQPQV